MTGPSRPAIRCAAVSKRFGDALALDGFDLEVPRGMFLSLLGPSGCGKTTALRVIAGFESPDSGSVAVGDRTVIGPGVEVPPERRRVGMVFQDYALFPHMSVADNVGYGLTRAERPDGTRRALQLVDLEGRAGSMPHELSGGQQQRVALARALAPRPEVVLLDEPFSNLDAGLRARMRRDVRSILERARATAVFVTHDQEEALAMADLVAVMRAGRVVQVGTPRDVYGRPVDRWTAEFIGEASFLDGRADGSTVETALGTFGHGGDQFGDVTVMVRPEWITLDPGSGDAVVVDHEYYGHDQMVTVRLTGGDSLRARLPSGPTLRRGDAVAVGIDHVVVLAGE